MMPKSGLVDQYGREVVSSRPRRRIDNWLENAGTGMGTPGRDKSLGVRQRAVRLTDQECEDIYTGDGLAAKAVDIPVDDSLQRWRTFEGPDAEEFKKAERKYKVKKRLSQAAKDGRVYGTALVVMAMADNSWNEPLNLEMVHPGTLKSLIVVDKRSISNLVIDKDLLSSTFGEALYYDVTFPRTYQTRRVHASRTLRFDGFMPNTNRNYNAETRWGLGISIFVRLVESLRQLAVSLQSLAHLETEAGMPVIRLANYEDVLSQVKPGSGEATESNTSQRIKEIAQNRSLYYTTIMDIEDAYERLDVSFAGRQQLLAEYKSIYAAVADIPETRLFGKSPYGLNSTGDGDARNYASKVSEVQENDYDPPLLTLDDVIARTIGLEAPPTFKWNPLLDLSDAEQVGNRSVEMETIQKGNGNKPIMSVREGRRMFSMLQGVEWLDDGEIPKELVAPVPQEEPTPAEMAALMGGGGGGGGFVGDPGVGDPGIDFENDGFLPENDVVAEDRLGDPFIDPSPDESIPGETPYLEDERALNGFSRLGYRDLL